MERASEEEVWWEGNVGADSRASRLTRARAMAELSESSERLELAVNLTWNSSPTSMRATPGPL